jgi:Na+/H+-translocating membrane pyrophosphatase
VTELALILGIQAAGLAFAMAVGRSLFWQDEHSTRFQRVTRALERAALAVLTQAGRDVLIALGALGVAFCVLHAALRPEGSLLSPLQAALLATLGLVSGALLAGAASYAALRFGVKACARVSAAARASTDRALSTAVRAGGSAALIGDALALFGFSALFGLAFALKGGTALAPAESLKLGRELCAVLPGFTLGAALTALVVQRAAGTYRAASEVGASIAGELEAGLSRDDPRNPALVGSVAGTMLSGHAATVALWFTLSSASHLCMLALATHAVGSGAPVSSLLVPFVVRAFFVLACAFALMLVRTEDFKNPSFALLRGHLAGMVIGWTGIAGTALWLVRNEWLKLALAGGLGLGVSLVGAVTSWVLGRGRPEAPFEVGGDPSDPKSTGLSALSSVGKGFEALLIPVVILGPLVLFSARAAAADSGGRETLLVLVGWAALVGMLPFTLASGSVGTTALAARAVARLAGSEADAELRVQRLSDSRLASPRAASALALSASALLAALTLPALAARTTNHTFALLEPVVLWAGALGAGLVLAYTGAAARVAARGAEGVALEVERQLRVARRTPAANPVPDDFSPSYKACVDLAAELSQARSLPHVLAALALPVVLAVGLRLLLPEAPIAVDALISFVAAAGFTGFAATLTLDATQAALAGRRLKRAADGSVVPVAAASEALTSVLGHAAGPAAQAAVLAMAAVALTIAPFLT